MYAVNIQHQLSSYRDLAQMDRLQQQLSQSGDDIKKVAGQFESLFVNMMLKSMREASQVLAEENYLNSFETKMYQDMLDEQISISLADTNTLGLAEMMMVQLDKSRQRTTQSRLPMLDSAPVKKVAFTSAEEFFSTLLPFAEREAMRMELDPKFLLAQAALETGWGKSVMHSALTGNSHNLFGIKADRGWYGDRVVIDSGEVEQGGRRPKERRIDDPEVDGLTMLVLDRLATALHHAMDYAREAFPDDDSAEFTLWMNGAIFGAVATFVTTNYGEVQAAEVRKLHICVTDVISDVIDRYGKFDLDQYAQDFLHKVGFDGVGVPAGEVAP